ncbi:MAG: FAD:protein FMN transferase [Candidatus Omnitrophica bacterium]|nr:FAD:protein FMN transferase [Candidatus Omnitrophota bacterium]
MVKKRTALILLLIFASILIPPRAQAVTGCSKPLYKKKFIISGTYLEVISPYREAAGIVYGEFKRLDKIFNSYDSASELSRLNKTLKEPFKASDELIEILQRSWAIYNLSEGAFDVTQGSVYKFWKELIRRGEVKDFPALEAIRKIKASGGIDGVEVDFAGRTVTINKQGLTIDLGAIAKGYIIDKAIFQLKQAGIKSALINAGGDIYCLGRRFGKPWKVGIKSSKQLQKILETQLLIDQAVATSGGYEQFFSFQGKDYSHLIDPRKGYPVDTNIISVSVIAEDCTTADSLATTFFILGAEGLKRILNRMPQTMRVFVVSSGDSPQQIHIFKGKKNKLKTQ